MRITSGIHVTSRLMRKHLENKTCFHICTSTNIKVSVPNRNNCNTESKYAKPTRHLIKDITEVSTDHMTPEIGLHLVTPNCPLWHSRGEDCPFEDPFWAFYWPGGQALTRYILDHAALFCGRRVVDIGSGCGASSIACRMVGAAHVLANDIDTVASCAITLNAELNNLSPEISTSNLIGCLDRQWDIVLLGDMFYDRDFAQTITRWLEALHNNGVDVFVGDPGRLPFAEHKLRKDFQMLAEYVLPDNCLKENNGMTTGYVWKYQRKNS